MGCAVCGKDIPPGMGVCRECRGGSLSRSELRASLPRQSKRTWAVIAAVGIFCAALSLASIAAYATYSKPAIGHFVTSDTFLIGELEADYSRFRVSEDVRIEGRVYSVDMRSATLRDSGAALILLFLPDDKWGEYLTIIRSGRCAASFLNGTLMALQVFGRNASAVDTLLKTNLHSGDRVVLTGATMSFLDGRYGKYQVQFSGSITNYLASSIKVIPNEDPLAQYQYLLQ